MKNTPIEPGKLYRADDDLQICEKPNEIFIGIIEEGEPFLILDIIDRNIKGKPRKFIKLIAGKLFGYSHISNELELQKWEFLQTQL